MANGEAVAMSLKRLKRTQPPINDRSGQPLLQPSCEPDVASVNDHGQPSAYPGQKSVINDFSSCGNQ